jgi:hypothetical protein
MFVIGMQQCHELFNHEASQSNDGACSSAAGDKAGFYVFRTCQCWNGTIQQLLTDTKHCQNDIIRYLPESQDKCASGGLRFLAIRAQMAPP